MGDIIRIILLVVIPPIGVLFTVGFGLQFILNVVLTLFRLHPGPDPRHLGRDARKLLRSEPTRTTPRGASLAGLFVRLVAGQDLNL